jgi:hypothetical protein
VELAERYRATELSFKDEDFFADFERVVEIADGLVDSGAPLAWSAGARPEDLLEADAAVLRKLSRAAAAACRWSRTARRTAACSTSRAA